MDKIIHIPKFIEDEENIFNDILSAVNWSKSNYFKRHVSHYENNIPKINEIIINIERSFLRKVIGVFINYYKDGNEYAPYHSDKYNCDTCLVSFGVSRVLRYKKNSTNETTDFVLDSGDLLFIPDEVNKYYKHSLLKRTKIDKSRISILFFLQ